MEKYHTATKRFAAGFVDGLVFMPLGLFESWVFSTTRPVALLIAWMLIRYPAFWLYNVLMHGFNDGQTVGKKALGIKVLDVSESPITLRQAFLRESIYIVINTIALILLIYFVLNGNPRDSQTVSIANIVLGLGALLWFIAEIVTCLMNPKRRALHDFIAGTVVVNTEYLPLEAR